MTTLGEKLTALLDQLEQVRAETCTAVPDADTYNPIEQQLIGIENQIRQIIAEEGKDPGRKAFIKLLLNMQTLGSAQVMLIRRGNPQVDRTKWGWDEESHHDSHADEGLFPSPFDFAFWNEVDLGSSVPSGLYFLSEDFKKLALNVSPALTLETLLDLTELDLLIPDGKTLPARLFNGPMDIQNYMATQIVQNGMLESIVKFEQGAVLMSAEAQLFVITSGMIAKQLYREGVSCEYSYRLGKRIQKLILEGKIPEGLLPFVTVEIFRNLP